MMLQSIATRSRHPPPCSVPLPRRRIIHALLLAAGLAGTTARAANPPGRVTLIDQGEPRCAIIVGTRSNGAAFFSALELQEHFKLITGAEVPILPDTATPDAPVRILVGESAATRALKLNNADFAPQEYLVQVSPSTIVLMGHDAIGPTMAFPATNRLLKQFLSSSYDAQATCYATYDFLEKFCDVRWYCPTDIGRVHPENPTLTIPLGRPIRRKPWLEYRGGHGVGSWGMAPSPTNDEVTLFLHRMRFGGEFMGISHSFEQYPARFWNRKSAAFESYHPEYFMEGYDGESPPQMCYTSTGLLAQVIKDATAFFDGKPPTGANGHGDYFSLVPRDTDTFCPCKKCRKLLGKPDAHFSDDEASRLVWGFTARVAAEFKKRFPGKMVGQLAYRNYAVYPRGIQLPTNIMVGVCPWDGGRLWAITPDKYEMRNYKAWVLRAKGRLTSMWMYQCFPMEAASSGGFRCFPGFYAHVLDKQMKMHHADGLRGIQLCGTAEYIDGYLTLRLMDDPSLDVEAMLEEFFERYYGPDAGKSMRAVYRKIESTFCDIRNYPNRYPTVTEAVFWKDLGTDKVMGEIQHAIEKALEAEATPLQHERVRYFERQIWNYMVAGKQRYEEKLRTANRVADARRKSPPRITVPCLETPATGDLGRVPWKDAITIPIEHASDGYPADRPAEFSLAHDGTWLYLRLKEVTDTEAIQRDGLWWAGDHWAIYLSAERELPYRYYRVPFQGKPDSACVGETNDWAKALVIQQAIESNAWIVAAALPLTNLTARAPEPGDGFYFNVARNTFGGGAHLMWSPTFGEYRTQARWGEVRLAK